jgi:peptidoglycan/LPS O-acetylase OafA/YrhL
MDEAKSKRLPGLDLLRAAAIVMVLLAHYPKAGHDIGERILNFGWTGVDLFFVLSGFLIGRQLLQPIAAGEPARLGRFYARRFFRTLPPYFAVLPLYFVAKHAWNWKYMFFVQNFHMPATFTPSWSLCVEEQFYLLFPLAAVVLFQRYPRRTLQYGVPLFLAGEVAVRLAIWLVQRPDLQPEPQALATYMDGLYYPTWCRLDGIALGVALAGVKSFCPEWWSWLMDRPGHLVGAGGVFMGLTVAALWRHYSPLCSTVGFTMLNLSFAFFTAAALSKKGVLSRLKIPGTQYVALISYSIYLTHSLAIDLTRGTNVLVAAIAILAVAIALHYAVERPSMALRDRLLNRQRSQPAAIRPGMEGEPIRCEFSIS